MSLHKFISANIAFMLSFSLINGGLIPEDPINLEYPDRVCQAVKDFKEGRLNGGRHCLLLYGPTGSGKSTFVENLANWTDSEILVVECADLEGPYAGNASQQINFFISKAKEISKDTGKKVIIVFEEVDRIACKVTSQTLQNSGQRSNAVATLWRALDRYKKEVATNQNIDELGNRAEHLFVFTTNRKNDLDPVFLRRIDNRFRVQMSYPDKENIVKFCTFLLMKSVLIDVVDKNLIDQISDEMKGLNYADIESVVNSVSDDYLKTKVFSFDSFKKSIAEIKKEKKEIEKNDPNRKPSFFERTVDQGPYIAASIATQLFLAGIFWIKSGSGTTSNSSNKGS